MKINFPFYQVDAFTSEPFRGNQAAVCITDESISTAVMQKIAAEINLPETAFLLKTADDCFDLKWFTPTNELPLCGHGTLAAAFVLWENGLLGQLVTVRFKTMCSTLTVNRLVGGWFELNFPAFDARPVDLPEGLNSMFPTYESVLLTNTRYMVVLETENMVKAFQPDFNRLKDYRLIVTAPADEGKPYDFVSRYFAGPDGVAEDPVTGSSHCSLAPFWSGKLKKRTLSAYQCSARGGYLRLRCEEKNIYMAGQAVALIKGVLSIEAHV